MKRKIYHVLPSDDGDWKVKQNKAERAIKIFENKTNALDLAKNLAKKADLGQVIVHDKKGVIQTEYTYGQDPEKTKG